MFIVYISYNRPNAFVLGFINRDFYIHWKSHLQLSTFRRFFKTPSSHILTCLWVVTYFQAFVLSPSTNDPKGASIKEIVFICQLKLDIYCLYSRVWVFSIHLNTHFMKPFGINNVHMFLFRCVLQLCQWAIFWWFEFLPLRPAQLTLWVAPTIPCCWPETLL